MGLEIVEIDSDSDRAAVEAFFAATIADPSRYPLLRRSRDPHREHRSYILTLQDDGDIVAALHAAPPVPEVQAMARSFTPNARASILQEFVMLYSIAVVATRRGEGLGAAQLVRLRELALADQMKVIYGVCSADSVGFYEAHGFRVLPRNKTLVLRWAGRNAGFPISGDNQWFTIVVEADPVTEAGSEHTMEAEAEPQPSRSGFLKLLGRFARREPRKTTAK